MNLSRKLLVRIYYPADPAGIVPGGVDTFLRGIISLSPSDIDIELIGATADHDKRPIGRWSVCFAGAREYRFFPVLKIGSLTHRSKIPLSLRYTARIFLYPSLLLNKNVDVLEFHRLEPALLFILSGKPKNLFVHQNMNVIRNKGSDIVWRYFPGIFELLQKAVIPTFRSVWCVRQDAVDEYKKSYPEKEDRFRFIRTWVDVSTFFPLDEKNKRLQKIELAEKWGISLLDRWVSFVGRFDRQKDPILLIEAFARAKASIDDLRLILIGGGVLESEMRLKVESLGLAGSVHFIGPIGFRQVAEFLQCSELFALASAYEGMPMSALEALGCGVPVVCTDVGELRRVVVNDISGWVSSSRSIEDFSLSLIRCLNGSVLFRPETVASCISEFVPEKVLIPVFENYRVLASESPIRGAV